MHFEWPFEQGKEIMPNVRSLPINFTTDIMHETCLLHDTEPNVNVYIDEGRWLSA
jgi:hypothetical protein